MRCAVNTALAEAPDFAAVIQDLEASTGVLQESAHPLNNCRPCEDIEREALHRAEKETK